jgi:DNA helicase HerA-like ATPase
MNIIKSYDGREIDLQKTAMSLLARCLLPLPEKVGDPAGTVYFGKDRIVLSEVSHMVGIGMSGSGKTLTFDALLFAILSRISDGEPYKLVLFDPKGNGVSKIRAAGLDCDYMHINDRSSSSWDVAKDIHSYSDAVQLASSLIPEKAQALVSRLALGVVQTGVITHRKAREYRILFSECHNICLLIF